MNIKTEIVALAVRVLAENGIIRKPDAFNEMISEIFTGQSYDKRMANEIVAGTDKAVTAAKRIKIARPFKKNPSTNV